MRSRTRQTAPKRASRLRRGIAIAMLATAAALVGSSSAVAAVRTGVTVTAGTPLVSPVLGSDYGAYNFSVDFAGADDPAAGFIKGPKVGHCIESDLSTTNTTDGALRTGVEGSDLSLANGDPANVTVTAQGRSQLEWLLLSSRRALADLPTGPAKNFELAAHQHAIWQLTNPSTPGQPSNPAEPLLTSPAFLARSNALVADSATFAAGVGSAPGIVPTGAATCSGTSRTLQLTGTPFTSVTLQITSGAGQFTSGAIVAGGQETSVDLGADGTASVTVTGTAAGVLGIGGTFQAATLVQVESPNVQRSGQDFAYMELRPETVNAALTFLDCSTPPVTPPPPPVVSGGSTTRLRITKAGPTRARAGDVVRYVIRVRNQGTAAATNVVVTDIIPGGLSLVKAVPGAQLVKGRLVWNVDSLDPGQTRTFVVRFKIDRRISGRRCNTARAGASNAPQVTARACTSILVTAGVVRVPSVTG